MADAAPVRLLTARGLEPQTVLYRAEFPAPMLREESICSAAQLLTGDGQRIRVGDLCSPGEASWREQRTVVLPPHRYAGTGPYRAQLRWGQATVEAADESGATAPLPEVMRFTVHAPEGNPMARKITVEIAHLDEGLHLRLDGGAGQVRYLTAGDLQAGAVESLLAYSKPGPYRVTLDLLDAEHFLLATLAEREEEVAPEGAPLAVALEEAAARAAEAPAEMPASAAEPWLPYRYLRPRWNGVRTYAAPGGGAVSRVVDTWTFLSARAETAVAGGRWFQTALGDWVSAEGVSLVQTSGLRGVALDGVAPPVPDPPPVPAPPEGNRQGLVVASVLNVRARPGASADNPPIDQLAYGTRVTIYAEQSVAAAIWYRIGENRWVHGDYVRIETPVEPQPAPPAGARRGVVTASALNVRARPGVAADNPPIDFLRGGAEVTIYEERTIASAAWYRIGENRWVHGSYVRVLATGAVRALQSSLAAPGSLPLGWVVPARVTVHARPGLSAINPPVQSLEHNAVVAVLEERQVSGVRWLRIGDDLWVDGRNIGVARAIARRAGIGSTERWVSVCLAEQTLVAYEGDRPVYAALVATGVAGTPTVQGLFRTWSRLPTGRMAGPGYYLEDVTWTCYFYSGYSLHTAYWHDAFGRPRSHGCVNMSPYDAWWIFQWSAPGGPNSPLVYVYQG